MREMLIVILNECEGSVPVVRKAVRCHSEYAVYPFRSIWSSDLLDLLNNTSASEGSAAVVRKAARCHQSNRFFTPCHISAFLLSYKAFLSPFRMTIEGESVMMRGTIRRHNEGNVNRHPERMWRICTRGEKSRKMSFRVCRIPLPKHMIKYFAWLT